MAENKRFIVSIDNKNGVGLYDGDIQLLYFQFNNIHDATECKDALKHQCSLMNELHEENEQLKKEILHKKNKELKKESESLKHHLSELQGQNEILTKENENLKERVKQLQINNKVIKKIYKTFYKPIGINQEYITENEELKRENEELKQQLVDIDKLIYDLGHDEMQRQYEEIIKEDGE